jgi:NAD dependent epimerase/dehydratase
LKGKSVLITGGMGFIGSHLAERLVQLGAKVRVLGRYNSVGRRGWLEDSPQLSDIECLLGDVRDRDFVERSVAGVDIVFHLAALIGIPYSYAAPQSYVDTNVSGTLNLLTSALKQDVARFIHTSTSEVYGSALFVPITEEHPLRGQSPYSASKIGADKIAESFHCSFELPVVTVRPFNTFGPRQSVRAIIPTIIDQCLHCEAVHLGSLTPTRDFNFVSNTVDGFIAAGEHPDAVGKTFNFGCGKEISIQALQALIQDLLGTDLPVETEEKRVRPKGSEVDRLLADFGLANSILGWEPRVTLRQGLAQTIEWLGEQDSKRGQIYAV